MRTKREIPHAHVVAAQIVFDEWTKAHNIDIQKVLEEREIIASRIGSWVDKRSILAGVEDVMAFLRRKLSLPPEQVKNMVSNLAERMIKEIEKENLLTSSLKRGSSFG